MDEKFTDIIREWLQTPDTEKDFAKGAQILLKLSNNKILYRNVMLNPKAKAKVIIYHIKRYFDFREQKITHQQVLDMQKQADAILEEHTSLSNNNPADDFKKGKRLDHDELPDEIKALYVENLSILQKMRDVQTKLRILSTDHATCADSDRYPFLKELIQLDKKYHDNWYIYDHYSDAQNAQQILTEDVREQSATALRLINLNKGKYRKNPTDELKSKILELYSKVINPSDKITSELTELGILNEA